MTKKHDKRLEDERNHWRQLAQRLKEENADLHRRLERYEAHARVWAASMGGYDAELERLQRERDQAIELCNMLILLIQYAYDTAKRENELLRKRGLQAFADMEDMKPGDDVPASVYVVMTGIGNTLTILNYEATHLHKFLDLIPNPARRLAKLLLEALFWNWANGVIHAITAQVDVSNALSGNPYLLADLIIRELRHKGEIAIETLQELPIEWIQRHLPDPPSKHLTLQEGLETRQREINSGLRRGEFERISGITRRRLQEFAGWYDAIAEAGRQRPDGLQVSGSDGIPIANQHANNDRDNLVPI